uniref:Endonuclease/exonuclease/phosphatase domain-containing protein n=1 Tax=Trichogramma kaykai TaxID=54128 RepID=A0ABD2XF59_9HYME
MPGKRVLDVPQLPRWSEHPELAEMSDNEETHQTHLTQQALNNQNLNNYKKTNPKASYSQVLKHNTNNRPSKTTKKTYQGTSSSSTDVYDSSEEEYSESTNDNTKKSRKKCLRCKSINSKQNRDGVDKQLAVTSLYRSPHYDTEKKEWSDLLQSHKNFDYIVIGGDFNSHHPAWGSTEPSKSGENLIDTISNHDIIVINDGSHTYYKLITSSEDPSNKHVISSALDFTLISSSNSTSTTWRVTDDKMHSDHFPVEYTITTKTKTIPTFYTHKLKLKKTNWKLYHSILHRFIEDNLEQINGLSLIQQYGIIIKTMKIATKTYLNSDKMNELLSKCLLAPDESTLHEELDNSQDKKIKLSKHKSSTPPWWNDECIKLVSNRRKATTEFLKDPSTENLEKLKQIKKETKKTLQKIKTEKFKNFIENKISRETDIKEENYPLLEKKTLNFDNNTLKPLKMIKYLGMIMDHRLTWTPHINNIIVVFVVVFIIN